MVPKILSRKRHLQVQNAWQYLYHDKHMFLYNKNVVSLILLARNLASESNVNVNSNKAQRKNFSDKNVKKRTANHPQV